MLLLNMCYIFTESALGFWMIFFQSFNLSLLIIMKYNYKHFSVCIRASWNYSESRHGKGSCDGIGGTEKLFMRRGLIEIIWSRLWTRCPQKVHHRGYWMGLDLLLKTWEPHQLQQLLERITAGITVTLSVRDSGLPFDLHRRQFPITCIWHHH